MEAQLLEKEVIKVPPARLAKIKPYIWGNDKIFYAADVTKLHLHGGKATRFLVITAGAVYIITTKFSKFEINSTFNIIKLEKVSYIEDAHAPIVTMAFGSDQKPFTCQTPDALLIGQLLLAIHKVVAFRIETVKNQVKVESNPPNALTYPTFKRVGGSLITRIYALARYYETKFGFDILKILDVWDMSPNASLRLPPGFQCGVGAKSVGHALAWESEIKTLILDGACQGNLKDLLESLFGNSQFLLRMSIDNYKEPMVGDLELHGSAKPKLSEIAFKDCHVSVVLKVLAGLRKWSGVIHTVTLSGCQLSADDFGTLFDLLSTLPCLMSMKSLRLENGTLNNVDFAVFSKYLSVARLLSVSVSKTQTDTSTILSSIATQMKMVTTLFITFGRMFELIPHDFILAESLMYLDLGRTQFSKPAFASLIEALFTRPRKNLLILNIAEIGTSASAEEIVECFNIPNAQPILAELCYSMNELTPKIMGTFLSFLRTQKYLMYLSVCGCFRENASESLAMLSDFIIEGSTKLNSIDITSDRSNPLGAAAVTFIDSLVGKTSLETLIVDHSGAGDEGLESIVKFVEANPKLTTLACDGMNPRNSDAFIQSYKKLVRVERLVPPRHDIAALEVITGVKIPIPSEFKTKQPPRSVTQRLSEYSMVNPDSTIVVQPMEMLLGWMGLMVNAIEQPEDDQVFSESDITSQLMDSLVTTNIELSTTPKATDLFAGIRASNIHDDIVTQYRTMHV